MSTGSNVSDAAVVQIDSSNASQVAAPDIIDFCGVPKVSGVPNVRVGIIGFATEMTASTDPSISKGLRTCIESGTDIKTKKTKNKEPAGTRAGAKIQQFRAHRMLAKKYMGGYIVDIDCRANQ
jgi:hypothetical protein